MELDNLMTCDMVISCSVNIIVPDKLALEKPYDQDQQCFLHHDCKQMLITRVIFLTNCATLVA